MPIKKEVKKVEVSDIFSELFKASLMFGGAIGFVKVLQALLELL
jgi:hypothetical protein